MVGKIHVVCNPDAVLSILTNNSGSPCEPGVYATEITSGRNSQLRELPRNKGKVLGLVSHTAVFPLRQ